MNAAERVTILLMCISLESVRTTLFARDRAINAQRGAKLFVARECSTLRLGLAPGRIGGTAGGLHGWPRAMDGNRFGTEDPPWAARFLEGDRLLPQQARDDG